MGYRSQKLIADRKKMLETHPELRKSMPYHDEVFCKQNIGGGRNGAPAEKNDWNETKPEYP